MTSPRVSRARTAASELAGAFERAAAEERAKAYPLMQYQADPVRYVLERLREPHVMPHQAEILEALAEGAMGKPDASRPTGKCPANVSVRSCQKAGKTKAGVWASLWWYECQPASRVFMCAAIVEQSKNVLWRELADTLREAERRGVVIDGKLAAAPAGGFVSSDGSREIRGVSGRDIEALAGLSGNIFTWIDEASHMPEGKAQAFAGNTLGGGLRLLTSNPTRNEGPFHDTFHQHQQFWATFHVDGEEVADWQERTGIRIPYVISREKIEEFRLLYGTDSPFWHLRVKGNWLRNETGRCITMARIEAAVARYILADDDGDLTIGYDCAGPGDAGDEHAWAVARGNKCLAIHRRRGLSEEAALAETYALLQTHRAEGEMPRLIVDAEGPIGSALFGRLRAEAAHRLGHDRRNAFEVFAVRASNRFVREPMKFERTRDELVWNLAEWLRDGAIPDDAKLQGELYAPSWETTTTGKLKCTAKSDLRDVLGRSPDSFDALALAVWRPMRATTSEEAGKPAARPFVDPAGRDNEWAWQDASTGDPHDSPFWPGGGG